MAEIAIGKDCSQESVIVFIVRPSQDFDEVRRLRSRLADFESKSSSSFNGSCCECGISSQGECFGCDHGKKIARRLKMSTKKISATGFYATLTSRFQRRDCSTRGNLFQRSRLDRPGPTARAYSLRAQRVRPRFRPRLPCEYGVYWARQRKFVFRRSNSGWRLFLALRPGECK